MTTVLVLVALFLAVIVLAPRSPTGRVGNGASAQESWLVALLKRHAPGRHKKEHALSCRRAIEVATGLAAAVEAGLAPRSALPEVVSDVERGLDTELLDAAAHAAAHGNDVAGVLLSDARQHWRAIGIAWRVGEESGAAFAPVLDRVAGSLRTDERIAREARAALATSKATVRLLAILPLAGIGIGKAVGGDTLGFLFTTLPGLGCLAVGVAFESAGLFWTRSLLRKAEGLT